MIDSFKWQEPTVFPLRGLQAVNRVAVEGCGEHDVGFTCSAVRKSARVWERLIFKVKLWTKAQQKQKTAHSDPWPDESPKKAGTATSHAGGDPEKDIPVDLRTVSGARPSEIHCSQVKTVIGRAKLDVPARARSASTNSQTNDEEVFVPFESFVRLSCQNHG